MSEPDIVAERDRIAPPARATGFPAVGLTPGTDGARSARFRTWTGNAFRRTTRLLSRLAPEASAPVLHGNYERLFDEARRQVRAREAAQGDGGE